MLRLARAKKYHTIHRLRSIGSNESIFAEEKIRTCSPRTARYVRRIEAEILSDREQFRRSDRIIIHGNCYHYLVVLLVCRIRRSRSSNRLSRFPFSLVSSMRKHALRKTPNRLTARHGTRLWTERHRDLKPGPNWFHGLAESPPLSPTTLSRSLLPLTPHSPSPPLREHPHSLSRARPYACTIPREFLSFVLPFLLLLAQPGFLCLPCSFSFPLSLPPSSGTVPLLPTLYFYRSVALDFRPLSPFLTRPSFRPRSARIPTAVGSPLYDCLFLPARAMPCSDCLTPTLHVRTTERPSGSLRRQRTRSTISIFLPHSSPRNRALEVHPLPRIFRTSPTFAPHVPTPSFVRVLTSRSFQKYFDVRAHVHLCTWLLRALHGRGSAPANPGHMFDTSTRAIPLGSDWAGEGRGRDEVDTGDLFIILASKQAIREKGCYPSPLLFFPLWPLDLRCDDDRKKFPSNAAERASFLRFIDAGWKTRDFIWCHNYRSQ